jgi:uncharacterized protein YjiK
LLSRSAGFGASLFSAEPDARWRLPEGLREVSGLALTPDGRVMGHDDEVAIIYEVDVAGGAVVKRFMVGDPAVPGDFEGLAIAPDGDFYLATSDGELYRFREGDDGAHVGFEAFDTGLRHAAEIEGLAFHVQDERLVLAAKTAYSPALQGALALWSWSPLNPENAARSWLTVPCAGLAAAVGARSFHASGLEIDKRTGRLVILAAREHAIVELDAYGGLLAARGLGARHRQAEGVTIMADGALVIADEGGDADAFMTRYPRAHA